MSYDCAKCLFPIPPGKLVEWMGMTYHQRCCPKGNQEDKLRDVRVTCPTCGSIPFFVCTSKRGNMNRVHKARKELARNG